MATAARPRVLVAEPLADDGLDRLRQQAEVLVLDRPSEDELMTAVPSADALLVRSATRVTAPILEAGRRLRVVGRAGVGVDNIDVEAATRRGVVVVNAPRGSIVAAAEHTIGLLLALARWIPQADASVRRGEWDRARFLGTEVRGKTLGVVGLGNIGSEVARRAQGLGMEVLASDPAVPRERAELLKVELVELEELFSRSDFVTVHVPLVESTRNLIGDRLLSLCRHGARLINAARGGIVDETALARALREGRLAGAAADVFEHEPPGRHPLLELPNFVGTPHIAASTAEAQASVAAEVAEEVLAVLRGELPRHAVNAPTLPPEEIAFLRPFLELAERLASLHVQLEGGRVSCLEVRVEGELAEHDSSLVTAAAIKGLCQPFTEERISPVNARLFARGRGLEVVERRDPSPRSGYPNVVTLGLNGHELSGTVLAGEPRVTRIGQLRVDLVPEGRFLVTRHDDRPGVVGRIGTILGQADVNIASMQVARDRPRGRAMMFVAVDDPVDAGTMRRLRDAEGLRGLHYVQLGRSEGG
jgi:D-3-phosphoglycerate dehydrogenase